jgi:hypothetical protein
MSKLFRTIVIGAAVAAVAVSSAACSSSGKSVSKEPVANITALTGQSTAVKLDAGFVSALTSLKLTPGVVGTAQLTDGSVIFPITGGNVRYYDPKAGVNPFVQGDIKHDGSGLSLTAGSTKVELTNFDVDPGASRLYGDVSVNGAQAAAHAFLFDLDGTTLKALQVSGTTAILEGTTVKVSGTAAGLLDKVFSTDAVKGGLVVGIAKITVNTM